MKFSRAAVLVVAIATWAGCSDSRPATYPVQGRVHFADGQPVPVGIVEFRSQSDGRIAKGRIDQKGHFVLSTFGKNDGAVAGEHQVIVLQHFDQRVWSAQAPRNRALPPEHGQHEQETVLVHRRFAEYGASGLTAAVKPQPGNPVDLNVGEPMPSRETPPTNR